VLSKRQIMERLLEISKTKVEKTSVKFKRFLLNRIDFSQPMIGIKGARGTGKTTLLLQQMKSLPKGKSLYVSLDDIYFSENKLVYLAEDFHRHGGQYLFIDEVHKYKNWSQELKNIYDNLPNLKVVFTSSSALEIHKGKYDLSRRVLLYELPGLSFREFLWFKYNLKFEPISLEQLLNQADKTITKVQKKIKPYQYFSEYLKIGYYPYFKNDEKYYHIRLNETINVVLENDLPAIYNIDSFSIIKLKKLLYIIGSLVPFMPNINKLSQQVGTTRDSLLKYLHLLHNAHILKWLSKDVWGINFLNKPDKLFLENTNIAYAANSGRIDKGNLRETFFLNQLSVNHRVSCPKKGDFLIDNTYLFEIGGKNKTQKQIAGIENAYVAADDIEYSYRNKIPLWLFGFMY